MHIRIIIILFSLTFLGFSNEGNPSPSENRVNCNYCNWNLFTIILNLERVIGISIP